MRALSEDEILEWIEGTSGENESPLVTKARFDRGFGLGVPRDIYNEMARSFDHAMARWHMKKSLREQAKQRKE